MNMEMDTETTSFERAMDHRAKLRQLFNRSPLVGQPLQQYQHSQKHLHHQQQHYHQQQQQQHGHAVAGVTGAAKACSGGIGVIGDCGDGGLASMPGELLVGAALGMGMGLGLGMGGSDEVLFMQSALSHVLHSSSVGTGIGIGVGASGVDVTDDYDAAAADDRDDGDVFSGLALVGMAPF
jgi:hypothetical protein